MQLFNLFIYLVIISSETIIINAILRANECKIADVFEGTDFI